MAHIAHLICELHVRLELVGLAHDRRFALPLTQTDIAARETVEALKERLRDVNPGAELHEVVRNAAVPRKIGF